jgi:hypothetical protein
MPQERILISDGAILRNGNDDAYHIYIYI